MDLQQTVNEYARAQRILELEQRTPGGAKPQIFSTEDQIQATSVGLTQEGAMEVTVGDKKILTIPRGRTSLPAGRRVTLTYEKGAIHSYW